MLYIATLIRKEYFLNKANLIIEEVNKVIIGKEKVIRKVWMTILSGGHVLLEDVPGVGKTTMALAFSKALGLSYRRIQFTPDVMHRMWSVSTIIIRKVESLNTVREQL